MLLENYQGLKQEELESRIVKAKTKLSRELVILGHHYQREEIIKFADFRGDSFGLSKIASEQKQAKFIVFCGVHFMASAARILARRDQRVFHPDLSAGCPMADMASVEDVENAWNVLGKTWNMKKVVPVVYMNSVSALKAFCGQHGGVVCTSSNAIRAFDWALTKGDRIFFFPDEHLGRNTARAKGISKDEIALWDPNVSGVAPFRARQATQVGEGFSPLPKETRLVLWNGFCHVHTFFTVDHVKLARKNHPGCKIIVHPECREEVVMAANENASTEGICKFVASEPKGSTVVIGTEINLISRLAKENSDKNIVPLERSLCPNMFKISLNDLCWTLEQLAEDEPVNEVIVPDDIAKPARIALDRMLKL